MRGMKGGRSELGMARADLERGQAAMDPLVGLVHLTTVLHLGVGEVSRASGWVSVKITISLMDRVEATMDMRPAFLSLSRHRLTYELERAWSDDREGWASGQIGLFVLHIGWATCVWVRDES